MSPSRRSLGTCAATRGHRLRAGGRGLQVAPDASLVVVTPGQQAPLGSTLSLARRIRLLDWAAQTGAWIIEDDYLSELH